MNKLNINQEMQKQALEAMRNSKPHFCGHLNEKGEACNNPYFIEAFVLREISPLYTQDGKPKLVPMKTMVCIQCLKEVKIHEQETVQKNNVVTERRNVPETGSVVIDPIV